MNKYSWITLGLVAVAMTAYSIVTVTLFSRGLERQMLRSEQRMKALARYSAETIDRMVRHGSADNADIDAWLAEICATTRFERIVVADSVGLVHWSSQDIIRRGDDISPYLVDSAQFVQAARTGRAAVSAPVRIENTFFKSLYYPLDIADHSYVVVVEADQNYYRAASQFRNGIIFSVAVMAVVLMLLTAALVALDRTGRAAQARARRHEELAFLGRASAELAHELKNPLGIIKSSSDVLRRKYDPQKSERAFEFLSDEIMRLSRLVGDILSFSREKKLLQEPFYAAKTLDECAAELAVQYPGVSVSHSLSSDTRIIGDHHAFAQIASNLMRNAARAMAGNGAVRVETERNNGRLEICFRDTGPGIPDKLIPRLFDPFVSGSRTGTGLGLAIVRTLCEASGWCVSVDSHAPGNTSFRISIPEELWRES